MLANGQVLFFSDQFWIVLRSINMVKHPKVRVNSTPPQFPCRYRAESVSKWRHRVYSRYFGFLFVQREEVITVPGTFPRSVAKAMKKPQFRTSSTAWIHKTQKCRIIYCIWSLKINVRLHWQTQNWFLLVSVLLKQNVVCNLVKS